MTCFPTKQLKDSVIRDIDRFEELTELVNKWGIARGLLRENGCTVRAQAYKMAEEAEETADAYETGNIPGAVDGLGDQLVVLIQQCRLCGITLDQALEVAWKSIKERRGQMVAGIFIKQDDWDKLKHRHDLTTPEAIRDALQELKGPNND